MTGEEKSIESVVFQIVPFIRICSTPSAKENTGLHCANEAVAVTGGIVLLPEFKQGAAA